MIPEIIKEALDRYAQLRYEPGGFLMAVLSNDLVMAVKLADYTNMAALREIVDYAYNELPGNSWGTPERVQQWLGNIQE